MEKISNKIRNCSQKNEIFVKCKVCSPFKSVLLFNVFFFCSSFSFDFLALYFCQSFQLCSYFETNMGFYKSCQAYLQKTKIIHVFLKELHGKLLVIKLRVTDWSPAKNIRRNISEIIEVVQI